MEASVWMDESLLKLISCETAKPHWDFDEHGQRSKLKPGWEKAQTEYNRTLGFKGKSEKGMKFRDYAYTIKWQRCAQNATRLCLKTKYVTIAPGSS